MGIVTNYYSTIENYKAVCEKDFTISKTAESYRDSRHHVHNSYEIVFIESGRASYIIEGKQYFVEAGDVLTIDTMAYHQSTLIETPYTRYGLTFKPSYLKKIIHDRNLQKVFITPPPEVFNKHYKNITPDIFKHLISLLECLHTESTNSDLYSVEMQASITSQISIILFRQFYQEDTQITFPKREQHMFSVKNYINQNFDTEITLNNLSSTFFIHPAAISRDFKACCGISLKNYINLVRIGHSCRLLKTTACSVQEISELCGFNSINTFLRVFKKLENISPLQYRKIHEDGLQNKNQSEEGCSAISSGSPLTI